MDWRPLEGFVLAITPFNFTAIAGNLPAAPAMCGNTVVWKPSGTQMLSAHIIMNAFKQAGLPDGVINMVAADGPDAGRVLLPRPELSGVHFTGSTATFQHIYKEVGGNIDRYNTYPRMVGETGGKDFVFAHNSADPKAVSTALSRGAFEYQGQKCSAASRAYIPTSQWNEVKDYLAADLADFKMGTTRDFSNFINAVIDERSFDKIESFIQFAKDADDAEVIMGGKCDKSVGYFVEPTVILTTNPNFKTMVEEIFGPVMAVLDFEDEDDVMTRANDTEFGLAAGVFTKDLSRAHRVAANFEAGTCFINSYNDAPVEAPFGGSKNSGVGRENSKAAINYYSQLKSVYVRMGDVEAPF